MFHRHFDDHMRHAHGGKALDTARFAAGALAAAASAAGKAGCSTGASSNS